MIMSKGKIVASDTPENLSHRLSGASQIMIRVRDWSESFINHLRSFDYVHSVYIDQSREKDTMDIIIQAVDNTDIRELLFTNCYELGYPLLMMKPVDISLEEIFLQLTENQTTNKAGAHHVDNI